MTGKYRKYSKCDEEDCNSFARNGYKFCVSHGGGNRCEEEGCKTSARGSTLFCRRHGGGNRCKEEGCKTSAVGSTQFCVRHGGGNRCEYKDCKASSRGSTKFCKRHGGGNRCEREDCEIAAQDGSKFCSRHGGGKKCEYKNKNGQLCIKSSRGTTTFCVEHGGGNRCEYEDKNGICDKSARSGSKFCAAHGGGNRCPNCIDWIDSRSGCKKYDGYCATCFKRVFPLDSRSTKIREKTWEIKVRNYINEKFTGFIHDIPLWTGNCECVHRRRVDHRKLFGNTILAIETDERKHTSYDKEDERLRYNDLYMIHSGKWIFIRFNPDASYKVNGVIKKTIISRRLIMLEEEIIKQINRINGEENSELLEIVRVCYDV